MNKRGKESLEDGIIAIVKIGLILFVGYLILKAIQGA